MSNTRAIFQSPKGAEIVVEDGSITIGGELVHRGVQAIDLIEIKKSPKVIQTAVRQAGLDFATHVWLIGGIQSAVVKREVAAEAIRQYAPIALAKKEREEAIEAARVDFYVCGWEGHRVRVTSLENLEEQFEKIARYYANDGITVAIVKDEYEKRLAEIEREKADKLAAEQKRAEVFAKARTTGEKQVLDNWMAPCNDPNEQCSDDACTEYALPDGTTKVERVHTW
jgi:hypothetical protein